MKGDPKAGLTEHLEVAQLANKVRCLVLASSGLPKPLDCGPVVRGRECIRYSVISINQLAGCWGLCSPSAAFTESDETNLVCSDRESGHVCIRRVSYDFCRAMGCRVSQREMRFIGCSSKSRHNRHFQA